MNDIAAELDFGKFDILTKDIRSPDDHIRARTADPNHVATLITSFKKWDNPPTDIQVLVILKPGSFSSSSDVKVVSELPSKRDFDIDEWYPTLRHHGFQVICGDHSVLAIKSLMGKFKNNEKWKVLNCQLFIGMDDDPNVVRFAQLWGTTDNLKKTVHRKVGVIEQLLETHRLFYNHPQIATYDPNSEKEPEWVKQFRADRQAALGLAHGLWGQNWILARMNGPVWDHLVKIFTGNGVSKGHVSPKSICHFVHTAFIPDELIVKWLQDIINGQLTPKLFQTNCQLFKTRLFVRNAVLDRICFEFKREEGSVSWEDACLKYRNVTDAAWIEAYVAHIGTGAKIISEFFKGQMEKRLTDDVLITQNKIKVQQQVFVSFCS